MVATGEQAAPQWASTFKLPEEARMEADLDELRARLDRIQQEMLAIAAARPKAQRFRKLLYAQGEDLQTAVHEALQLLGGAVQDGAGDEADGARVTDPTGMTFLLETRGLAGQVTADELRHLYVRMGEAIAANPDLEAKPLLVVNAQAEIPPRERTARFPDTVVRTAQRFGQCVLPTTQLFEAVRQLQGGSLDKSVFWATLRSTSGICALLEPEGEGP